ncbi:MAG: nucleoside-diphosphate kinase [Chloroflexia bacterium]
MERTLIILKPDAVQRGLIGEVLGRLERRGLKVVGMKMMSVPPALAKEHYAEHVGKPFYEGLIAYITSSPVVVLALEGKNAVSVSRSTIGATNPANAAPGTIRADLAVETGRNLIHGSADPEAAAREVALWFGEDELASWPREADRWIQE